MADRLTDSEKLMYDVMGAIADGNVPVIYKGAMITKLILHEHDFDDEKRVTDETHRKEETKIIMNNNIQ